MLYEIRPGQGRHVQAPSQIPCRLFADYSDHIPHTCHTGILNAAGTSLHRTMHSDGDCHAGFLSKVYLLLRQIESGKSPGDTAIPANSRKIHLSGSEREHCPGEFWTCRSIKSRTILPSRKSPRSAGIRSATQYSNQPEQDSVCPTADLADKLPARTCSVHSHISFHTTGPKMRFPSTAVAVLVFVVAGCMNAPIAGTAAPDLDGTVEILALNNGEIEHAESTFQQEVNRSDSTLVLVDCWAPWCGPCRALAPELEELKKKWKNKLVVVKLNVDDNPALAAELGANAIPAVRVFRSGTVVTEFTGLMEMSRMDALLKTVQ